MSYRDLMDAVDRYCAQGWPIFPVSGKIPRSGSGGSHDGSDDPIKVREAVRDWRACDGLALSTGRGFVVVDFDSHKPMTDDEREAHEALFERMPETWLVSTTSGGVHLYYATSEAIPNSASKIAPLVDVRGTGGYVVIPPSPGYVVAHEAPIAPLPEWLAEMTRAPKQRKEITAVSRTSIAVAVGYGAKILDEECRKVEHATEGTRNHELNECSFRVGQRVGAGEIDEGTAREYLLDAALRVGLTERESIKTINSGLTSGMMHPKEKAPRVLVASQVLDEDALGIAGLMSEEITEDTETTIARPTTRDVLGDDSARDLWERTHALGGLCSSYLDWVQRTADFDQPLLAVASLLALGSVLGARRLSHRGLTTSSYVVSIAPTTSGKGRPQSCLQDALANGWPELAGPNDFSSTASTLQSAADAAAQTHGLIWILDEYGPRLRAMMGESAHQAAMRPLLLAFSTLGTSTYNAAQSLSRGGKPIVIQAPGVCLYGSTTPEALHAGMSRASLEDGFLGRHLFFGALATLPRRQRMDRSSCPDDVREMVTAARTIHDEWQREMIGLAGDKADPKTGKPIYLYRPQEITIDADAEDILAGYGDELDERRRTYKDGDAPLAVLGRAEEHARRIAMCLALLARPGQTEHVTAFEASIACELAEWSAQAISRSLLEHAHESEHEKTQQRVLAACRAQHAKGTVWVRRREIARATRNVDSGTLDKALQSLAERGEIELRRTERSPNGKGGGADSIVIRATNGG